MKFTLADALLIADLKRTIEDIRRDQLTFQGQIMSKFDDLVTEAKAARAAADASAAAAAAALEATKNFQPAVDAFEKRITDLLKKIISPADMQKVDDALAELQAAAATSKKSAQDSADAAAKAVASSADAADNTDEAASLATTFPDKASFDAAVTGYDGGFAVTLDGTQVLAGDAPALDYFTHSADGHIDMTGPTD